MTVRHRISFVIITCVLAATPAVAGKPQPADARAVAEAFLAGLRSERGTEAARFVGKKLEVILRKPGPDDRRCDGRAETPAAIAKLLACLAEEELDGDELEPWTRKSRARLAGPLAASKARLARLAQRATLVTHHERCIGEGSDLVVAVAFEGKQPRVIAIYAQSYICGE